MPDKKVAVVFPVYLPVMSREEEACFRQACRVFRFRDKFLVHPEGLDIDAYARVSPDVGSKPFSPGFFAGITGYNRLMLSPAFYEAFRMYEYVLVCQLDVFVFADKLDDFLSCEEPFDYIGAPWHGRALHLLQYMLVKAGVKAAWNAFLHRNLSRCAGNGGFSLRRVERFEAIARLPEAKSWKANEDYFWSFMAKDGKGLLRIPGELEAARFCIETSPAHYAGKTGTLPMALHAYRKYDFGLWKKAIAEAAPGFPL